jgi:lysophospholipase L1-like esterase
MRKNRILVIALLGYSVIALSGCAQREITNANSKGRNIICFGDSMTAGYGVNPGEDYPSMLGRLLNLEVLNKGVDGNTTSDGLQRLKGDVLDQEPRLVIIEFGGNDFLKKIPKETTVNNIREMIEMIQAQGAMVAIVDISSGMFLREYSSSLYRLARSKNAIFASGAFAGIITNPRLKSDFLHPNAEGYKIIAQRIHRAISPYLNRASLK